MSRFERVESASPATPLEVALCTLLKDDKGVVEAHLASFQLLYPEALTEPLSQAWEAADEKGRVPLGNADFREAVLEKVPELVLDGEKEFAVNAARIGVLARTDPEGLEGALTTARARTDEMVAVWTRRAATPTQVRPEKPSKRQRALQVADNLFYAIGERSRRI